jgi:hypothetical protein
MASKTNDTVMEWKARSYCTTDRKLLHVEILPPTSRVSVSLDWGPNPNLHWYWNDPEVALLAAGFVLHDHPPHPLLDWLLEHEDQTGYFGWEVWHQMNAEQRRGLRQAIERTMAGL